MTMWVTGANGFIGRHLVRALADRGHVVHGLGHGAIEDAERSRLGLCQWLNGEIDAANLNALAGQAGPPSTIFHLAGGSSVGLSIAQPYEDFSRTVSSTGRLLEWLRGFAPDCRLVAVSSAAVYGGGYRGAIKETDAALPVSPYGHHKLMMEELCRSYATAFGLHCTIARLFSVYGPDLRKQLLWDICSRLQQGEQSLALGGTGAEVRDWTDVRDVARLLAMFSELPQREPYRIINGGSGHGTSVADVAGMLVRHWGEDIAVRFSGEARAGDPFRLICDDARLRELSFDWRVPVEQGIADYVRWFRDRLR
jgi:UDP-glucose 4-epimerase